MSHFFAILARMKFIKRWGLMRSSVEENIQEHTMQVAMIAHNLAVIRNTRFGGKVDAGHVTLLALYHEVSEVYTGDMPTPIKYFNKEMRSIYAKIEKQAQERLLQTLPADQRNIYKPYILEAEKDEVWPLVKAADTISAFLKCAEEKSNGNHEFNEAYESTLQRLQTSELPEVAIFLAEFIPSFSLSLDEMNKEES